MDTYGRWNLVYNYNSHSDTSTFYPSAINRKPEQPDDGKTFGMSDEEFDKEFNDLLFNNGGRKDG